MGNLIYKKPVKDDNGSTHYTEAGPKKLQNELQIKDDGVFEGGMLPETNVFADVGKDNKWKLDYSSGDTFTDSDGKSHPLTISKGQWKNNLTKGTQTRQFDTRNTVEKDLDRLEGDFTKYGGMMGAVPAGYVNMANNTSKSFTGGGVNEWKPGMVNPYTANRSKARATLGTDLTLMALSGGLPGAKALTSVASKFIPKQKLFKAYADYAPEVYKRGHSYYKNIKRNADNPLGVGLGNWVEDKAGKFLQSNKSGKTGDVVHGIAEELADFNSGATKVVKETLGNILDDNIKNPIKSSFKYGGILYKNKK